MAFAPQLRVQVRHEDRQDRPEHEDGAGRAHAQLATAEGDFQVLDTKGQPFLELREDGVWLDSKHPWAKQTELFYTPVADSGWVKVSETGTITYAEPRLDAKPKKASQTGEWAVPVKLKGSDKTSLLEGELKWQRIEEPKP